MSDVDVGSAVLELYPVAPNFAAKISSEISGDMNRAGEKAGRDFSEGMGARIRSAASSIFRPLAIGAGILGGLGIAGGKMGLEIASGNEQAEISFTTMLGSAKKADAFLGKLQKFAASTPFEFPELQTAASSLISAGISANKVIPIMRNLGDATSGMGTGSEGVKRATIALQQMSAAGKITGEDLNQLRDAGIPVFDLLAAATGKSKREVADLAAKGKLGAKELGQLMKALETGKGLERFSGLMDKQSASLTGMISTFKDVAGQGLAAAVEPLIPLIKDGIGKASELVASYAPKIATNIQTVVAKLPTLTAGARGLLDLVTKGDYSGALGKAFGWEEDSPVIDRILRVRGAVVGFFDLFAKGDYNKGLRDAFNIDEDSPVIDKVLTIRSAVVGFFALLTKGDYSSALRDAFGWEEDNDTVTKVLELRDTVLGFFSDVKGGDFSAFAGIGDSIGRIVEGARPALEKVPQLLSNIADSMPAMNAVVDTGSSVFGFFADHIDVVVKAIPFLLAGFALYKTAQAANNVVGRESLIGFGLQLSATIALTIANRRLAASQAAVTATQKAQVAAQGVGLLTTLRQTAATVAGSIAQKAAAVASKIFAAGQWLVNAALSANPIGIVVLALAALVAGLVYAWKNSETFRSYVSTAFSVVKIGALSLAKIAVTAFQFLANVFMTVVGTILDGAAAAFGWVPGIGPKLQGAATQFETFKTNANASLDKIKDDLQVNIDTEQANIALEALHREFINKGWTVTAEVNTRMVYGSNGQLVPAPRATGGPTARGQLIATGDNPDGSWNPTTEVWAPTGAGHVFNQDQLRELLGGGVGRLHPADIAAIGRAVAAAQATPVMDPDRTSQALMRSTR